MSSPPVQIAPAGITPPPALGPPIIGTDAGSIAGEALIDYASGSATSPATPIAITGTPILPPPQVGFGNNALATPVAITPAPVPPSTAGFNEPRYASGSGTAPTVASLFPAFTAAGPSPPIVINSAQNTNTPIWVAPPALPLPTTPGTSPIPVGTSNAPNIPQLPWNPGPSGLPVNTAKPTITGTTIVGSTLTAATGTWSNSPTSYAYDWLRNGALISGANASTYVAQAADVGTMISVRVTGINASGEANADSAEVGPITATTTARNAATDLPPRPRTAPKPTHHTPPRKPTRRR